MKILSAVAAMAAVFLLAACSPTQPDTTVRSFYDAVHAGDMVRIRSLAAPELYTPGAEAQLTRLRIILPKEPPSEVKVLSRTVTTMVRAGDTMETQEIFTFKSGQAVVAARLHRTASSEPWKVQGFHVRIFAAADLAVNAFTFKGKTLAHVAFLLATIASPLLMIAALVKVVRRKGLRRKWLWGILAFVGLFSFQMNWTTGGVAANWLTVQIIGAGVMTAAPGLAPWMLTFTLPLGALLIVTGVWANPARAKAPKPGAKPDAATFD